MRFSAGGWVALAVLLVVLVVGLSAPVASQPDVAATAIHIELEHDGDARWTVSARFPLADENESAAFDRLANEYVTGETDVLSVDPYRSAAAAASEVTGREMAIDNVTRAADRVNDTGELRVSFVWRDFVRVEDGGERLVLGDVFATPTGTWLSGLEADQSLVIEFPQAYAVQSSSRALENGSIRVVGPESFQPGQPSATLQRTGPVPTSPGTRNGSLLDIAVPSALSFGAALALLLVAGFLVYRRRQIGEGAGAATMADPGDDSPDDELLSDQERVLRLLRSEGGRMKQVDIVEETDWSNAKVSQLLSSMAESGLVEKLRIGRENLISLPDRDEE